MRPWAIASVPVLVVSACVSRPVTSPVETPRPSPAVAALASTRTPVPTPATTPALPPTLEPTMAPTADALLPTAEPTAPIAVTSFADIPGNLASGEPAPDFTARVMGGGTFTLSNQHGSPVLVFPTVVGCGDCIFTLQELATAYPAYRGKGVKVVILNLYPEDTPESWQPFADYIGEPELVWGVVNSIDFVVQYKINSLGTILLVDPEGALVFRSEYPLLADEFWQLFDLATR